MLALKSARYSIRLAFSSLVALGSLSPGLSSAEETSEGASPVSLESGRSVGDVVRVRASLRVGGFLTLMTDGRRREMPMSVAANFDYEERILDASNSLRSIRHYDRAEAVLKIEKRGFKPVLNSEHRRMVAQWTPAGSAEQRTMMFSLGGPLTREELDLVDVVGGSLVIESLLPGEPVAVGGSWKQSKPTIAALLRLDAVAQCDVESVLGEVTDQIAKIAMAGTVEGVTEGIATEIEIKASYNFSLEHRRITRMELVVKEKRSIGHVGPGVDVVARLKMRIDPLKVPGHLTDDLLAGISTEPRPRLTRLVHLSGREDLRVTHGRRWYATTDQPNLTVLRMIDRGELVAQCNISELPPKSVERHLSLREFQNEVRFALGDRFGEFVTAGQWADAAGNRVFRVIAQGQVKQLPIQWRYYLIAAKSGRRVALSFTVERPLAERLGDADRRLVAAVELLDAKLSAKESPAKDTTPETATKPSPKKSTTK